MSRAALALLAVLGPVLTLGPILFSAGSASALGALSQLSWTASPSTTGTASTYTFTFAVASNANLTSVQFSLPTGTTGTPAPATASIWTGKNQQNPNTQTITRSGTTLTFSFTSAWFASGTVASVQVSGLSNTTTVGSYASAVTTYTGATQIDTGTTNQLSFTSAALSSPSVTPTSTKAGATGVGYTYRFTATTTASLSTVTMTLPPGTSGTAALGSVTPAALAGGSLTRSGALLSYTFTAVSVAAGTPVSISVTGLTNTSDAALSYGDQIATKAAGTWVDSAATDALSFTTSSLTAVNWSPSVPTTSATGVAYTYGFTTATGLNLVGVRMSVPAGTSATSGTPAVGTVSMMPNGAYSGTVPPNQKVALSGTTLTFSFDSTWLPADAVVSIEITGLTNTATAGNYPATIVTLANSTSQPPAVDSGVAAAATFTSTSLRALSWSASSTATGAKGVTYTVSFSLPASQSLTLSSITIGMPPGTTATPTLSSVSPPAIAGGTLSLAGQVLTYTPPATATAVGSASTITIVFTIDNTTTASTYASTVIATGTDDTGSTVQDSGTTGYLSFTSAVLTSLTWTATSTAAAASGVTYTFGFTTATGRQLTSVTMSVPTGTTGTPGLGTVSIYDPSSGTKTPTAQSITLTGSTLTYSFTLDYLNPKSTFSIQVTGLTNTTTAGSYASAITTKASTTSIDSGTTPTLAFSSSALGSPTWTPSSNAINATGVTYTYSFVPATNVTIDTVTMTVPSGTAGSPSISSISPATLATGGHLTLSGTTLSYTFTATTISAASTVTIAVGGVSNTATAGVYPATLTASWQGTAVASGSTTGISFSSHVLTALSWTASSYHTNTTGVSYTYGFTTGAASTIGAVTMTVPPGTSGTPGPGTLSGIGAGTVTLDPASNTLTFTANTAVWIAGGTAISIQVTGLTNPPLPGSYAEAVATRTGSSGGSVLESGSTPANTFVGGVLASPGWAASSLFTTAAATYTYRLQTVSTSALTNLTVTVPSGTSGTPALGSVTGLPAGGAVTLSGTTLTYSFNSTSVAANTPVTLQITGLSNPLAEGSYTADLMTWNGVNSIDTGTTTPAVTLLQDRVMTFTNSCPADPGGCSIGPDGITELTLVAIPGASVASTASVMLGVQTNAVAGYLFSALMSTLTSPNGATLGQADTSGTSAPSADQFFASVTLGGSTGSGAAPCPPYGSGTPYVGYSSSARPVWNAFQSTSGGTDVVTMVSGVRVSATQPAGTYTGTISYQLQPAYTSGTTPSCTSN